MTFFLLVVVSVTAGILVLYRGLRCIGCRVTYTALIVSVLLSALVTILGLRFIPFPTDAFYWCMALMVLTAAFLTAGLDAYLLRSETQAPTREDSERKAAAPLRAADAAAGAPVRALPVTAELPVPSEEPEERAFAADLAAAPVMTAEEPLAVEQIHAPPAEAPPKAAEALDDASAASAEIIVDLGDASAAPPKTVERREDAYAVPPVSSDERAAPAQPAISEVLAEPAKPAIPAEIERELASLQTLDNYLDLAFREERGGRMQNAVLVYRRAMELYAGDDYAPFIAIELANVCKEIGDFPAAAEALERGLHFPAVQANLAMVQEFRKNIRFLQTLHHMLERESLSGIPIRQVPKQWQEIAEEMAKETTDA
ncbi:hypothetical protein TAMA11512_03380 [Selenomonas sp. TAMA-11512]|uniref:hypothetical protein n=1 Tax=Selenomonas sp. TAMA-11512 TaxID=3095337 RepID=UPI00308A9517|nr:hypothetical protein TAMA11512_03380 [Selenomonas sp. TAMA-11512]